MSWTTPKTDWSGSRDSSGAYTGDYFNASDFNRIKNNLEFLRDFAVEYFPTFDIVSLGEDRTAADFFYADEINQLEENFNTINEHTFNKNYGQSPVYTPNGATMTFVELNRLESAISDLFRELNKFKFDKFRSFVWNFGKGVGL